MKWELICRKNISWIDLEQHQSELVQTVHKDPKTAFLLCSEPQPTFTYGRNSLPTDLLWSKDYLESHQIKVYPVSRGGKWTYHGPGQILIYPIMHLPTWGYSSRSVQAFLEDFRLGTLEGLINLGLQGIIPGEPFGLYLDNKKLASFGLAFQKGVSSHGVALYHQDQNQYLEGINPCGVKCGLSTALVSHLNPSPSWDSVANTVAQEVKNRFSLRLTQVL